MIAKRVIFAIGAAAIAAGAQAGNIPVIGSTEAATVSIVIPASGGAGSAITPASSPAVSALLGGGAPPSITGTPAQIQALLDFVNAMPPGPVRARLLAALGASSN